MNKKHAKNTEQVVKDFQKSPSSINQNMVFF